MPSNASPSTTRPATETPAAVVSPATQRPDHPGLSLAIIVSCTLMLILDTTVMNVALPRIRADLGFSSTGLAWVMSAYTLAFGGLLLLGGRAGDILGRRRVFLAGIALFTAASLVGGLAPAGCSPPASRRASGRPPPARTPSP
jgi:MFS family permease